MSRDVAIIGLACRFPGASDHRAFWANLRAGVESIRRFSRDELLAAGADPAEIDAPDYVPAAPVLDDVDAFDAAFFGYSPREARLLDPQHRLLLETSWAALEDAGYPPDRHGGSTGVFAGAGGIMTSWLLAHHQGRPDLVGPTGSLQHLCNDKDFLATRVSYKLNLRGPGLTVQTACSTSLVAVHLACRSLLDGECDMALAGGAAVRFPHVAGHRHERDNILSPDGHCRAFDAAAAGTVFGSGVGVVLLKPLDRALADGDQVYAVIKATAVNNDGGEKLSYTTSSVTGQARAMAEALSLADVTADSIGYVECHGTGTAVGDPLEVQALARAFGAWRPGAPRCAIGSVKTNIGHLEQAAGIAGLIKAALALHRRELPPSLWFETPNPRIDWARSRFQVCDRLTPWPDGGAPRRAAVNGLGLGGTNAFAVLEQAPARPTAGADERPVHLLALGARDEAAARRWAGAMAEAVVDPAVAPRDACFTANTSRAGGPARVAVVGATAAELARELREAEVRTVSPGPIAFLMPGQGAQVHGMGRALDRHHPVFRAALDRIAARLDRWLPAPVREVLHGPDDGRLHRTEFTQPALFAVELALHEVWRSWGVQPAAVLGHSVGEIAAAVITDRLTLEEGCRFVARRAALIGALPAGGAMLAVFAPAAAVERLIAADPGRLSLAAINSPEHVVVSGELAALEPLARALAARGIASKRLRASHAFHSMLMDPALEEIEAEAALMHARPGKTPLVANLHGRLVASLLDARYWRDQVRQPVQFLAGMQALADAGITTFVELGPGSTLQGLGRRCLAERPATWCGSLSGADGELRALFEGARAVYLAGHELDWAAFEAPWSRRRVSLPTYPFARTRHALPPAQVRQPRVAGHPLLGAPLASPLESEQFEAVYDLDHLSWNRDHRIYGTAILPTAAALEAVRAAAVQHFGSEEVSVEDVVYREAMVLPEEGSRVVQIAVGADHGFRLFSRAAGDAAGWRLHLLGRLRRTSGEPPVLDGASARCPSAVAPEQFYAAATAHGLQYGPRFQGIRALALGSGEAVTRVRLPEGLDARPFALHPALTDAALHVYDALVPDEPGAPAYMPVGVSRFQVFRPGATEVVVHARRRTAAEGQVIDLALFTPEGEAVAALAGLVLRRLGPEAVSARAAFEDWLHRVEWRPATPAASLPSSSSTSWAILADQGGLGAALAERLLAAGETVQVRRRTEGLDDLAAERLVYLWGLDDEHRGGVAEALAVVRGAAGSKARLTLVTRGATGAGRAPVDPAQALLWGFGRSAAHELGGGWGGLIDVDAATSPEALATALRAADREPELSLVGDAWWVPRLVRLRPAAARAPRILGDATYLVTGGLGAIGTEVLRVLAAAGARHLVAVSRSASRGPRPVLPGVELVVLEGDMADPADVARVLGHVRAALPPLRGIFHCAGRLDDGVIARMDDERLERVLRPKVDGAWHLHQQTRTDALDHFVLFSSILSIFGSAGQANYTAANAFLDALAVRRRAEGLPAQSVNWGPWADQGIATASGKRGEEIWRARGTRYIPPAEGARVFEHLLRRGGDAAVTITDWPTYVGALEAPAPLYAELAAPRSARPDQLAALRARFGAAAGDERRLVAREIIRTSAALVLGADAVADDRRLSDLGLDSLMAVALGNRLEAALGVAVPTGRLLEGPSVTALVDELIPPATPVVSVTAGEGSWVVPIQPRAAARLRLFCFPFAGGGSALFRQWADGLGEEIEVLAIEPPGRLRRIREAPISSIDQFVTALATAMFPWLDRPYACFGHCLGGLTMFETLRALRDGSRPLPVQLFAAGARPPHRVMRQGRFERELLERLSQHPEFDEERAFHDQPPEVFADLVRAFRIDASERMLEDPELRALMFPTIKAEFQMASDYVFRGAEPFDCPLTVFLGRDDPYVSREDALGWGRFTGAEFRVHTRPGAHFLLAEDGEFMLGAIGRSLTRREEAGR